MPDEESRGRWALYLTLAGMAVTIGIALVIRAFGDPHQLGVAGIPTVSRLLNQLSASMMTGLVLIIPLTANLYTPRLVRIYIARPEILAALGLATLGHVLLLSLHFFPPGHRWLALAERLVGVHTLLLLSLLAPFLYILSRFLRPSFFMPMLTRMAIRHLNAMARGRRVAANGQELFSIVDVMGNIALTGSARGDRQLVVRAMQSLHAVLEALMAHTGPGAEPWRGGKARFAPGLAAEGQAFLRDRRIWPEAYLIAQLLKIIEGANKRQQEVLAELAGLLVDSALAAQRLGQDRVVELHLMAMNTLLREVVDARETRPFMNLCYHYRLLILGLRADRDLLHEAAGHLIHYGRMAHRQGVDFSLQTVIYDLGELVLDLGRADEEAAVDLLLADAGPLWQEAIAPESPMKSVGWRTLVRAYWEAKVAGLDRLAEALYWHYLSDEAIHREQVELVLDGNRELAFEFNERLMRFAHLSPAAEEAARAFLEAW